MENLFTYAKNLHALLWNEAATEGLIEITV
jgi:hypothetical protein